MARVKINIIEISELKWMEIREVKSDEHYIYNCGQESFRSGVAHIAKNKKKEEVLGCNLKNSRLILVHYQGKWFNITVIQVCAPTTDGKEAEVDKFYEDLQEAQDRTQVFHIVGRFFTSWATREAQECWSV